jgi:hypothetical protein
VVAHIGAAVDVGVNVYVVVAELFITGDQLPDIPLFEVVGKGGIEAPEQYGPTCVKVGVVGALIVIVIVVVVAHVGVAVEVGVNV